MPLGKAKSIGKPKENENLQWRKAICIHPPTEGHLPLGKEENIRENRRKAETAATTAATTTATTAAAGGGALATG